MAIRWQERSPAAKAADTGTDSSEHEAEMDQRVYAPDRLSEEMIAAVVTVRIRIFRMIG